VKHRHFGQIVFLAVFSVTATERSIHSLAYYSAFLFQYASI